MKLLRFSGPFWLFMVYLSALMEIHGDVPLKEVIQRVSKNPACRKTV